MAAVGFIGGRALGSDGSQGASYTYDLDTPPYTSPASTSGLSKGGFSGFGASGIDGETIVSGRVRSVTADSITLETSSGGAEVVRITGPGALRRIEAASASLLRPGASVVVRSTPEDQDAATSVLVLSEP
jgi:hypothetical protein